MSMIGSFGLCAKSAYDSLAEAVRAEQAGEAERLIETISAELEASTENLENGKCSGEVFLALFACIKEKFAIDVRESAEARAIGERWREAAGGFDMVVFREGTQLLALEGRLDREEISQHVSGFFQADYGNAGELAWDALTKNLRKLDRNNVLIWRLY